VIGGVDGPFSGRIAFMEDGVIRKEEEYKIGEIVKRTEYPKWNQDRSLKVVSEFVHGVETKRTGWRDGKKLFEITFTVDETPAERGKPAVPSVPPLVPDKHGPNDGNGAPAKQGTTDGHGASNGHDATDAHGLTANTATTKLEHKWPAFVPGNPDFPSAKMSPSVDHEPAHLEDRSPASVAHDTAVSDLSYEQLRKRLLADGQELPMGPTEAAEIVANEKKAKEVLGLSKMETQSKGSLVKAGVTPAIPPVPKSVGPMAELRADHLVYVRDSAQPYTGNTTLFDENGKKTYEGDFLRGRRIGKGVEWYAKGYGIDKEKFVGEFRDNRYHEGFLYWYYSDGVKKIRVEYNDGKVAEARMWNRNGEQRW